MLYNCGVYHAEKKNKECEELWPEKQRAVLKVEMKIINYDAVYGLRVEVRRKPRHNNGQHAAYRSRLRAGPRSSWRGSRCSGSPCPRRSSWWWSCCCSCGRARTGSGTWAGPPPWPPSPRWPPGRTTRARRGVGGRAGRGSRLMMVRQRLL